MRLEPVGSVPAAGISGEQEVRMDEYTTIKRAEGFRLESATDHDGPADEKVLVLLGRDSEEIVGLYAMPADLWQAITQDAREFVPA